ncbi:MAG TPA: hypothetical protein PLC42_03620 [Parachlamydiaceae bacterium]|nr:hypothetical protein [Parachlamydiaceae bacterium]
MNNLFALITELPIKEIVKLLVAEITCLFGIVQLYLLTSTSYRKQHTSLLEAVACFSILLSPFATNKGIFLLIFLIPDLNFLQDRILFAVNPWHPKHVISILSFALALSVSINVYFNKEKRNGLSKWTLFFLLFNTLTSRPLLHMANQLVDAIL